MKKNPKFAVILSGCGRADGSEIHEATCAMLAVDCAGASYDCFAPNIEQTVVVNHLTGEKTSEKRNVLVESARIARGRIKSLDSFKASDFDAVIFPGGLGAVLNWCDFALEGVACHVDQSVQRVMEESYQKGLVIGAMCIAPVVVAKVLGHEHISVTIGNDPQTADIIRQTGAIPEICEATEVCIDQAHKIVTTPAYMRAVSIREVCEGADNMVKAMIELV
jgi:enhancing lycopene biosynthesis protein 2